MRRLRFRVLPAAAALALITCGVAGAYTYGRDYYVHRGFAALANLPRAGTGRLLQVSFYSPSLHRQADYLVYLPPGYNPARRYPVYYLLHGAPGRPAVFIDIANMDVRLDNQLSLGTLRPMILVYPDGRIGGSTYSDSEWANTPAGNFENYVLDVVHNVDHQFSTLPYRQNRVIAGFSAGAYGAINIALHHVVTFRLGPSAGRATSRRRVPGSSQCPARRRCGTTARSTRRLRCGPAARREGLACVHVRRPRRRVQPSDRADGARAAGR